MSELKQWQKIVSVVYVVMVVAGWPVHITPSALHQDPTPGFLIGVFLSAIVGVVGQSIGPAIHQPSYILGRSIVQRSLGAFSYALLLAVTALVSVATLRHSILPSAELGLVLGGWAYLIALGPVIAHFDRV